MDNTRRIYLDNIRWITVCSVVIYHVIYMYNGVQPFGVIGPFKEEQLQDAFQYLVYIKRKGIRALKYKGYQKAHNFSMKQSA